jgi:hypothetical protein
LDRTWIEIEVFHSSDLLLSGAVNSPSSLPRDLRMDPGTGHCRPRGDPGTQCGLSHLLMSTPRLAVFLIGASGRSSRVLA